MYGKSTVRYGKNNTDFRVVFSGQLSGKRYFLANFGTEKIILIFVPYRSLPENTVRNSVPYFFPKLNRTVPKFRTVPYSSPWKLVDQLSYVN